MTDLRERLPHAFGVTSTWDLGLVMRDNTAREIARHARVLIATAAAGDEVAGTVLAEGAETLAALARGAANKAGIEFASANVFLGGATQHDAAYRELLAERLRAAGCRGEISPIPLRPEQGAALVAQAVARREAPLAGLWRQVREDPRRTSSWAESSPRGRSSCQH